MITLLLAAQLAAAPPSPSAGAALRQDVPATVAASPVVVRGVRAQRTAGDPHEGFNRRMFRLNQRFDRGFQRPGALAYRRVVPGFLRTAFRNMIANLNEPVVFLNYLLQLKPGKAVETAARFAINSTLGIGGAVDIANTPGVRLPRRANGLGNTLARYGVGPGPYLFLPFVGPTTLRDLLGGQADGLVLPLAVGYPFDRIEYLVPRTVIGGLDLREQNDAGFAAILDDAVDPYATLRSIYLQDRASEVAALRGRSPAAPRGGASELDDPLADPAAPSPSAAPELTDPLADPETPPAATPPSGAAELADPLADPDAVSAPADPAPPADLPAADPAAPARR